ncbi:MAG: YbaB/EbfC family DNA-binding protein [Mycolicibacterium cosmeticum]|nr:YbaB/EbfC family DNA-binding protein [Mycolicibacterium cosmeticum]
MTDPHDSPWDSEDDGTHQADEGLVFEAFAAYAPTGAELGWKSTVSATADELQTVVFTAINPAGTVSVTALMDGRLVRVELTPGVHSMTETELEEEVVVIARLATRQALAGQHLIISALMQRLGQDPANTRSFLERDLHLPAPDVVLAERAQLFSAGYTHNTEDSPRR